MQPPLVSVIIPAYNAELWISKTIQSVLDQTFQDFEIIIVDDGSTDNTSETIHQFTDQRIQYIYQENQKASGARNTAITSAKGEFIAFLDADDLYRPTKLEKQLNLLQNKPLLGAVTCGFAIIDEQDEIIKEEQYWHEHPKIDLKNLVFWDPLLPSTMLIRRSWFDKVGLFDTSLVQMEDREFSLRLAYQGCEFDYVKEILLSYRRHRANKTKKTEYVVNGAKENIALMNRIFNRPDLSDELKDLRPNVFANIYLDSAAQAYGNNLGEEGNKWLEMALTLDPDLMYGTPPRWVVSLTGFALGTLVEDWQSYIKYAAVNLSRIPKLRNWSLNNFTAQIYASQSFIMHAQGIQKLAQEYAFKAIMKDISLLKNRGLLKIALTSS